MKKPKLTDKELNLQSQSNLITLARQEFNIYEKRILMSVLVSFSDRLKGRIDDKKKGWDVSMQDDLFGNTTIRYRLSDIEPNRNYKHIKNALQTIRKRDVEFIDEKGWEVLTGVIQSAKIDKVNKEFFEVDVKAEFYEKVFTLDQGYTNLSIKMAIHFNSIYTIRIYELLAKWRNKPKFYISVDDLRFHTDTKTKFVKIGMFKIKVIDHAKNELDKSDQTDLRFTYEPKKAGRLIIGFDFYIKKTTQSFESTKTLNTVSAGWFLPKSVRQLMGEIGINLKGKTLEIVKDYWSKNPNFATFQRQIEEFEAKAKQKGANPSAFIIACLKVELNIK